MNVPMSSQMKNMSRWHAHADTSAILHHHPHTVNRGHHLHPPPLTTHIGTGPVAQHTSAQPKAAMPCHHDAIPPWRRHTTPPTRAEGPKCPLAPHALYANVQVPAEHQNTGTIVCHPLTVNCHPHPSTDLT